MSQPDRVKSHKHIFHMVDGKIICKVEGCETPVEEIVKTWTTGTRSIGRDEEA